MSFERKNLAYIVRHATDKRGEMLHILRSVRGSAIVYVRSRKRASEISGWLEENGGVSNFLITGCCTDICVLQFALSLKTEFNRRNRASRIIVPMDLSATYDAPGHIADFIDLVSFYNMHTNGIEVTPEIEY